MQKCTLLSWVLRLPRATVMCDCYSKVQGYPGSDPLYQGHNSEKVKASQGLHSAEHVCCPNGQPQMLMSVDTAQQHFPYFIYLQTRSLSPA